MGMILLQIARGKPRPALRATAKKGGGCLAVGCLPVRITQCRLKLDALFVAIDGDFDDVAGLVFG